MTDTPRSTEALGARPRTPELHALGVAQLDQLADMVLELAAQLHVERTRLRVLEHRLGERSPDVAGDQLDAAELPVQLREQLRRELDRSLAGLLAASAEHDDARAPLRYERNEPDPITSAGQGG